MNTSHQYYHDKKKIVIGLSRGKTWTIWNDNPNPNELQLPQIPQHGNKNLVIREGFLFMKCPNSKDSLMDQSLMLALLFTSRHRQIGT